MKIALLFALAFAAAYTISMAAFMIMFNKVIGQKNKV